MSSSTVVGRGGQRPGRIRRMLNRLAAEDTDLRAEELRQSSDSAGAKRICDCANRERVTVIGSLRTVTQRPRAGLPALEADLFDGSGIVALIWLGRRRILGVEPGRRIEVTGRIAMIDGRLTMYNPQYSLLSASVS